MTSSLDGTTVIHTVVTEVHKALKITAQKVT